MTNQPYIKEFKLVDGKQVLQNPIGPEGYLNTRLNRKQRRNLIKPSAKFSANNRKNRFYYQPIVITKNVETPIYHLGDDNKMMLVKSIITEIKINTSIKHRFNHLRKPSVS